MIKRLGCLVALIVVLVVGVWGVRTYQQISHVLTYRSLVREVFSEEENLAGEDLILAMIYTETKGKSDDLLQSSESLTGGQEQITDNKESVRQGVVYLTKNFIKADELGVDVWTAVQAYNFGEGYIDYIAERGGISTVDLARQYSRDVVAPSLGNTSGETYSYYNPIALYYGGITLYKNGGNSYYAKQVQFNLKLVKWVKRLSR